MGIPTQRNVSASGSVLSPAKVTPTGGTDGDALILGDIADRSNHHASRHATGGPDAIAPADIGAMAYKGTWNAATNTPTLTSGGGGAANKGAFYVVSVAGATSLNGENNWPQWALVISTGAAWVKGGTVELTASGGVNGTTPTAARGNHYHDVASSSANGYMSAADRNKLDSVAADSEWRDFSIIWSGSNTGTTPAANTAFYPTGGSNGCRASVSFVGISQVKLACLTGTASSNFRSLIEVSLDGGATYKLPGGATWVDATPSSVANAETFGPCILSSANGPNELLITIPAWLQQSGVMVRGFAYDTVGGSNRTVNRMVLKVQNTVVYAGNPIKERDVLSGSAAAGPISPALIQKWQQQQRYGVPDLYFPGRTVKDVTRDFGANNLTADVVDPFNKASITAATNDKTKFRNIMAGLTGKTELVIPTNRFVRVNGPVWCANNVDIVTPGSRGSGGICNENHSLYSGQVITFGTQGNQDFTAFTGWLLAAGVGGRPDIYAGDKVIRCPVPADYEYFIPGSHTAQIVLVGGYQYYYSGGGGIYKPVQRMTFEVIDKDIVGGERLLYLDEEIPYDVYSSPNPTSDTLDGGYHYRDALGPINGCAFAALYDIATGDVDRPSYGFHATNVSMHNLLLLSTESHWTGQFPRNGLFQNCNIVTRGSGIYGNCPQRLKIKDSHFVFGRDLMEVSMSGYALVVEGCSAEWNNDTTYGVDPLQSAGGNLMSLQEGTRDSVISDLVIFAGNWNADPSSAQYIFRSTGNNNKYMGIKVVCNIQNMTAFYTTPEGSSPHISGNEFRDIIVVNTNTTQTTSLMAINGPDHKVRGIKVVAPLSSSNKCNINASGLRTLFEDFDVPPVGITVNAGASNCRINRCDPAGSITNSASATVVAGAPNLDIHRVSGSRWGSQST